MLNLHWSPLYPNLYVRLCIYIESKILTELYTDFGLTGFCLCLRCVSWKIQSPLHQGIQHTMDSTKLNSLDNGTGLFLLVIRYFLMFFHLVSYLLFTQYANWTGSRIGCLQIKLQISFINFLLYLSFIELSRRQIPLFFKGKSSTLDLEHAWETHWHYYSWIWYVVV